jgi:hypothetical protein
MEFIRPIIVFPLSLPLRARHTFLKACFNITLPSKRRFSKRSLTLGFPTKTLYAFLYSPSIYHLPHPDDPAWFDHRSNIRCGIQFMKLLMHVVHDLLHPPLSPHVISSAPSACVISLMWGTKFLCHIKKRRSYSSVYFSLPFRKQRKIVDPMVAGILWI